MTIRKLIVASACALAFSGPAQAVATLLAPTEMFFAEDTTPAQQVSTSILNERTRFLAQLATGAGSYGFEDKTAGDPSPLNVTFTNGILGGNSPITASLLGTGVVSATPVLGRFSTTPGGPASPNFWEVESGANGAFEITFSRAVSAFGFHGIDIGDFQGGMDIFLRPSAGGAEEQFTIDVQSRVSGSLFFWGFASRNNAYRSIRFVTTSSLIPFNNPSNEGADFFGFDDFIVADLAPLAGPSPAPEPGSLALAGLALLGLGVARRRRG